jgi:hypothetical protein
MKFRFLSLLALLGVFAFVAAAADVTGKWTAEMQGRNGNTQTVTFNLKADGSSLTGNITNARGDTPISEGKIDGDKVSFNVKRNFNGNEFVQKYKGTIDGDTLKLTITMTTQDGQERNVDVTAKRAK